MLKSLNNTKEIFFSAIRVENDFQGLKNGQTVRAKILNLQENGSARIFFNGKSLEGTIAGSVKEGELLNMRVLITEGKIFLVPEDGAGLQKLSQNDNLFAQLGLPKNELSSAILSFLMTSESRFDAKTTTRLFNFLKNIKKNKRKAGFAAGILNNKGLDLTKELFRKLYPLIFGEEFGEEFEDELEFKDDDSRKDESDKNFQNFHLENKSPKKKAENDSDKDILELINHINSGNLHWLVLPFDKQINDKHARGSVSLLLDTSLKNCRKLVMHCKLANENWVFSLENKQFTFMQEDGDKAKSFSKKEEQAMEELFSLCLKKNGLDDIAVRYKKSFGEDRPTAINISV